MTTVVQLTPQGVSPLLCETETSEQENGLSTFVPLRPRLFGIAYRMLGSAAEAEDITQEVWLRWQSANRGTVENPAAYLATTTTRLCINLLESAYIRRETNIPTWSTEPADTRIDPGSSAERAEAWKLAVQLLLKKLSPIERAAFVMREAFDCPYRQIADTLQIQEANARQLVTRARKRISDVRQTSGHGCGRHLANDVARKRATKPLKTRSFASVEESIGAPLAEVLKMCGEPGYYSPSFDLAG